MSNCLIPLAMTDGDAEPRARDLDIANALGMSQPRNIRQTIETNRLELEQFGVVHSLRALITGSNGTREATEYLLNEEQALLICALSRTEKAAEVRRVLIKTFVAFRRGQVPHLDERTIGGIVKAVVNKAIGDFAAHKLEGMIEAKLCRDPRLAAVSHVPALQVVEDHKVPQKGRGGLVRRVSRRLERFCNSKGYPVLSDVRGTNLFPAEAVSAWLSQEGRLLIQTYKDTLGGQQILPFKSRN